MIVGPREQISKKNDEWVIKERDEFIEDCRRRSLINRSITYILNTGNIYLMSPNEIINLTGIVFAAHQPLANLVIDFYGERWTYQATHGRLARLARRRSQ
jgi:hypothetical protein